MKYFLIIVANFICLLATAQQIIDTTALNRLLKEAEKTQSNAVVIYKDGKLYGEYYFGKQPQRIEAMSSTKSIVNLAIGKLITDGLIQSVDQPVSDFYPEWKQGMKKDITIRMLMNHTSGMQNAPNTSVEMYPSPDFVKLALAAEITDKPGTKFSYNNKAVNLLGGIVKLLTRKRLDNYLYEKVFEPLGIDDYDWTDDEEGNPHCMSGFQVLPKDMAKLGQFFLQKGKWEDKQLINASWFDETVKPNTLSANYGLLWWLEYKEIQVIIDDAQIDTLKKIGFDEAILKKIKAIKGTYNSADYFPIFNEKIVATTPDWNTKYATMLMKNGLMLSKKKYNSLIGYSTNGFLGNYMVVYPDKNLVVLRMINWENFSKGDGKPDGSGPNNFAGFFEMAKRLVP